MDKPNILGTFYDTPEEFVVYEKSDGFLSIYMLDLLLIGLRLV